MIIYRHSQLFTICRTNEAQENDGTEDPDLIPVFRAYTVFNLEQTSLAGEKGASTQVPAQLEQLLAVLDVNISEFGNQPHFQPAQDVIVMPQRKFFNTPADYDITLLHELVHWTGGQTRLDRETIRDYGKTAAIRAEEELIAEIGSVFLAGYFGLEGDLVNHASYVASWRKHLDARAVGRAMSQASRAFEWLVDQIEENRVEAAA